MPDSPSDKPDQPASRPWISLQSTFDVEAWIDNYNRALQRIAGKSGGNGYGICFYLEHGGEIYLHTPPEGDILLDVTPDAAWAMPVISAATGVALPTGQVWQLPADTLTQLVYGLNSLIGATRLVLEHDFGARRKAGHAAPRRLPS